MPWRETSTMCERLRFIMLLEEAEQSMSELCEQFGISRTTGYKWLERYNPADPASLADRSRAPHSQPRATSEAIVSAVIAERTAHRKWGPRKLAVNLAKRLDAELVPAASTIGDILKRHGLVPDRRRRRHATPSTQPLAHASSSNRVWCADFKGWFRTGDGARIEPLTVSDAYSRYLLCCQQIFDGKRDAAHVWALMELLFREYGLPERMRTDNGAPFATTGLAGLSRLSVWWMRLGIVPERIEPGEPSQNGRLERLHLTLKQETAQPPASTASRQQERFDRFRREYNEERPHEALGQVPPDRVYEPSPRAYPGRLPAVEYPYTMQVRMVRKAGQMKWGGRDVRVTEALAGEPVGLLPVAEGVWEVYYSAQKIGMFDEVAGRVYSLERWRARTPLSGAPRRRPRAHEGSIGTRSARRAPAPPKRVRGAVARQAEDGCSARASAVAPLSGSRQSGGQAQEQGRKTAQGSRHDGIENR